MTKFEQELVKAIEYGCPECQEVVFSLDTRLNKSYDVSLNSKGQLDYDSTGNEDNFDDEALTCEFCDMELWNCTDGWIPELAEVVKGENNAITKG